MNSPFFSIVLLSLVKLGAVMLLIAVLEFLLRRAAPRWRMLLLRSALIASPLVIMAALAPAFVQVPRPFVVAEETVEAEVAEPLASAQKPASIPSDRNATVVTTATGTAPARVAASTNFKFASNPAGWKWTGFWLTVVWGLGMVGLLFRELRELRRVRRKVCASEPADDSVRELWDTIAASFGLQPVDIRISGERQSPFLWPGQHCLLVIPACLVEARVEHLEHVFRHEAAHLRSADPFWILAYRAFACCCWLLPPCAWLAARHLRACEEACDAEAARRGGVSNYGAALADLALRLLPVRSSATAAFLRPPNVRQRLELLPVNARKRAPRAGIAGIASISLLLGSGVIGNISWAQNKASSEAAAKPEVEDELLKKLEVLQPEMEISGKLRAENTFVAFPPDEFSSTPNESTGDAIKEMLESGGIVFEGKWAMLDYIPSRNQLHFRNTKSETEKARDILVEAGFIVESPGEFKEYSVQREQEKRLEIRNKLDSIIIPSVEFVDTPLRVAIDKLRQNAKEMDPEKKGINFILQFDDAPVEEGVTAAVEDRPITIALTDTPLSKVLRCTLALAALEYEVETRAVLVRPVVDTEAKLYTNIYVVHPAFLTFARSDTSNGLNVQKTALEVLGSYGIVFGPGAGAVFNPKTSKLVVKQTTGWMFRVETVIEALNSRGE